MNNLDLSICLLEKGVEIGAHILSGALFDPCALNELIPNWESKNSPLKTFVTREEFHFLTSENDSVKVPKLFTPPLIRNKGNYIIILGKLCRWLADKADLTGTIIFILED